MIDKIHGLEIPSEDWVEGFYTAMQAASHIVDVKCYPTLVGMALRSLAEDVKDEWEKEHGKCEKELCREKGDAIWKYK